MIRRLLVVGVVGASAVVLSGCSPASLFTQPAEDAAGGSSVFDVKPGDCIVEDTQVGEVADTQIVSCDAPHTYEAYHQFAVEVDGDSFPGVDQVKGQAEVNCNTAFTDFIGKPYEESTVGYSYLFPNETNWKNGDRDVTCLVKMPDNSITTNSLKGSMK